MSKATHAEAETVVALNQMQAGGTVAQALACLLFVIFSMVTPGPSLAGTETNNSVIQGTVTECWEGKQRPVPDLRVYVLATEENSHILALLKNIEQTPVGGRKKASRNF